jgi:hypothetical protein
MLGKVAGADTSVRNGLDAYASPMAAMASMCLVRSVCGISTQM